MPLDLRGRPAPSGKASFGQLSVSYIPLSSRGNL